MFAQDTRLSSQFARQWKLRMTAQEAALKDVANSKLRGLLVYNKSRNCADVKIGDTALSADGRCWRSRRIGAPARMGGWALSADGRM